MSAAASSAASSAAASASSLSSSQPTELDLERLREAIAVATRAVAHGNHPFGAVLTDADGRIVLEAENSVTTDGDCTAHAETALIRLASHRYTPAELRDFTLYTSCEPCAMCSGAMYWAGVGRVVYALGEHELMAMTGSNPENPTMSLPCRTVFAAGQRDTIVVGPALHEEAAAPHLGFWD
ncbi:nucleoside deaminase [Leifsonia kafniensis]|uniref:Nucleoside deaminase n=1 Tax=Leifsonia kafniensis TaxID=475957 RepID=A0ABP7L6Z4_9MICO